MAQNGGENGLNVAETPFGSTMSDTSKPISDEMQQVPLACVMSGTCPWAATESVLQCPARCWLQLVGSKAKAAGTNQPLRPSLLTRRRNRNVERTGSTVCMSGNESECGSRPQIYRGLYVPYRLVHAPNRVVYP